MSTLSYKGIIWEINGMQDGKAVFSHGDCTLAYDEAMDIFLFSQDDRMILARESRTECLASATDCILDAYANLFVPSWADDEQEITEVEEIEEIEAEEAA